MFDKILIANRGDNDRKAVVPTPAAGGIAAGAPCSTRS
jgi:hypothetical protein